MLLLFSILLSLGISAGGWFLLQKSVSNPWKLVGATAGAVALAVISTVIGISVAKNDAMTAYESREGYELSADVSTTTCTRDGSCAWTYDCDYYQSPEPYIDSKGNTKIRMVQKHHECPYVTAEYTYTVMTELGNYTVASHIFSDKPQAWRAGQTIPGGVERGVPALWQKAYDRIASGRPGGVAKLFPYKNPIYASDSTLLKAHSSDMERYRSEGLLPKVASDYSADLQADKVYGVNFKVSAEMQEALTGFNAAFGDEKHGDMHLVIVKGIDDPDAYTNALHAYWQSRYMGKHTIGKNALVVVLGTKDGKTVSWARSFTSMPVGNEALTQCISSDLVGAPLDADKLLGSPRGVIENKKVARVEHTDGLIENLVWGPLGFQRVSMSGDDGTSSGFNYMSGDVQISVLVQVLVIAVSSLLVGALWFIIIFTNASSEGSPSNYRRVRTDFPLPPTFPRARLKPPTIPGRLSRF